MDAGEAALMFGAAVAGGALNSMYADRAFGELGLFDPRTLHFLDAVQGYQDQGYTWSNSLTLAENSDRKRTNGVAYADLEN
jgi:hypothetical protein